MNLQGKVAVVTGGAKDIGRAVSVKLAQEGAKVVLNYFDDYEDAVETARLIHKFSGEVIIVYGDATKLEDIQSLAKKTINAFGEKVDVLVNVAGSPFARKTIEELDENFYDLLMDANFKSCVFVTQTFKPYMMNGGAIINFALHGGEELGTSIYASSKGAVSTFTRSMAKELGPQGISVNALNPKTVVAKCENDFPKQNVKETKRVPSNKNKSNTDIADLVAYLASDKASFITGNSIDINGGITFS